MAEHVVCGQCAFIKIQMSQGKMFLARAEHALDGGFGFLGFFFLSKLENTH